MDVQYRFVGLKETYRTLNEAPDAMLKAALKASRAAAKDNAKRVRQSVPSENFKEMVSAKSYKNKFGDVVTKFGFLSLGQPKRKGSSQKYTYEWFIAYWHNYGTLEGRDPNYQFSRPVKPQRTQAAKNRRPRKGLMHLNFFEHAIEGWEERYGKRFHEIMSKEQKTYFTKSGSFE